MIKAEAFRAAAWPTADEMALDGIKAGWGEFYDIGTAEGVFCAFWLFDGPLRLLAADTPEALDSAIRADAFRRGLR